MEAVVRAVTSLQAGHRFKTWLGFYCVEFDIIPVHVLVFQGYFDFLYRPKIMDVRLFSHSKVQLGENIDMYLIVFACPCDKQDFWSMTVSDRHHVTLHRSMQKKKRLGDHQQTAY